MWVLHRERITDFDGGFAEWEVASAERQHAAAVAAAEEEASRRVRERKATRRPEDDRRRHHSVRRSAERAVAEAEQCVADRERRVADLGAQLEDPALYLAPDGVDRARGLGAALDEAKAELETAFADWESATRALEAIG
jgi:ATPase subunit of ABC transporter with duplicated ATPase domains